ncbi:MAG TPA: riboflavin synthase [Chitinophagaceae bacterium]|nr:riboflavin synthase [Chitinophagaceae bacterium]
MFTGIIESTGSITALEHNGSNISFWVKSSISGELKIDQSVSHEGVCLTVDALSDTAHRVTAIDETLKKTNLANWQAGTTVNLERCMLMNGRLDGHIVQGHVDCVAICLDKKSLDGSWEYIFRIPDSFSHLIIEKGSIAINGTSLTCFEVGTNQFKVAIIPYTYEHTSIQQVEKDSQVNIEFDILGKYIERMVRKS